MNKKNRCYILTIVFFSVFMLFINCKIGYVSDDWHFKYIFYDFEPTSNDKAIESIQDIFLSMKNYYMLSGGRVISHIVLTLFLCVNKIVFNIINSFMFILLGWQIYKLLDDDDKNYIIFPFIYISILIFAPSSGETLIWMAGSINYLWCSVIFLIALNKIKKRDYSIFTAIIVLLSSALNEVNGGMLILFIILQWIIFKDIKEKKIIIFVLLAILGTLTVVLAPGNQNRAETLSDTRIFSFDFNILFSWLYISAENYTFLIYISLIAIGISIFNKDCFKNLNIIYMITAIIGILVLVFSGKVIFRSSFVQSMLLLIPFWNSVIYIINFADKKIIQNKKYKFFRKGLIPVVSLFCIIYLGVNLFSFISNCVIRDNYISNIIEAASKKDDYIEMETINYNESIFFPSEISNAQQYESLWMSNYYNINILLK